MYTKENCDRGEYNTIYGNVYGNIGGVHIYGNVNGGINQTISESEPPSGDFNSCTQGNGVRDFQDDVAFSYASEQEELVRRVAKLLVIEGLRVFYASNKEECFREMICLPGFIIFIVMKAAMSRRL